MDYDQFRTEYDPVFDVLDAETLPDWLPAAVTRLKDLAVTIEEPADRAARIQRHATAFGVPSLEVVQGAAPAALANLPPPDAIFIGGGASDAGVLDAALAALRGGGRLVVNAVTLETEALLVARHAALGGELIRIAISRAGAVGNKTAWWPAMPVTQWIWVKR